MGLNGLGQEGSPLGFPTYIKGLRCGAEEKREGLGGLVCREQMHRYSSRETQLECSRRTAVKQLLHGLRHLAPHGLVNEIVREIRTGYDLRHLKFAPGGDDLH